MENPNIKSLREFKKILKYIENVNNFFKKNIEFPLRTYEFNNSYMNNFIYISCGAGSSMEFKTKIRFESEFDDSLLESIIRNDNESLRVSKSSSGLITYLKNENTEIKIEPSLYTTQRTINFLKNSESEFNCDELYSILKLYNLN